MLKVLPIQSKETQEEICKKCNVKFNPELLAYSATVDDKLAGVCQFKLTDKGGMIYDLAPVIGANDFEALFVMGRATLNFIDLCGVHIAYFDATDFTDEQTVRAIGFKKNDDGRYYMDLTNFFEHPCSHE